MSSQSGDQPPPGADGQADEQAWVVVVQQRFERLLGWSRLLILIPVIFLLVDAAGSFVYGCVVLVTTVTEVVHEPSRVGGILGRFLIVMDTYLVGATFMIAAFGFYSLFIGGEESKRTMLPHWLQMHDLEDLKARVVSMLILVAAITFVDIAVETHDEKGLFWMGLGIAAVVAALTAFLRFGRRSRVTPHAETPGHGGSGQAGDALDG